jgi:monofunctional biosynthetic peptidoglycan transglycosylase
VEKSQEKEKEKTFRPFATSMKFILKLIKILVIVFFASSITFVVFYRFVNPPLTPLMVVRSVEQFFDEDRKVQIKKDFVPVEDISPYLIQAVVASEDNLFLQHSGFDFQQIKIARENAKKKNKVRGASTITQQCAKNVFLYNKHSWVRKGLEAYFTVLIELCWSKERIMEVYLNVIEYGDGVYGAEAAAKHYFNKSAKQLTKKEAALLAACLPNPLKRNPAQPTPYIQKRTGQIMRLMDLIGPVKFE